MKKKRYLPNKFLERVAWLLNYKNKLTTYAVLLGISPADVALIVSFYNMLDYIAEITDSYKTFMQGLNKFKNRLMFGAIGSELGDVPALTVGAPPSAVVAGIFRIVAKQVNTIKNHEKYTTTIGEELGIIGDEVPEGDDVTPIFSLKLIGEQVSLIWKKLVFDSINIYVDRSDGQGFVYLANDSQPDYLDTFPLTAGVNTVIWTYKIRYVLDDAEVGQYSDPVSITVTRQI